ncbi:peptidoglycan DD-metalloendopeptidase family protein [Caulobacter sp. KR2-114]|uniref:peptidoglycan DD-metalloendopeptidase family protein n=1 Tax=Caulobacter sp. KR2-114 TaxID=3400912 RepID=UPI003BFC5373
MHRFLFQSAMAAVCVTGLSACATPSYPVRDTGGGLAAQSAPASGRLASAEARGSVRDAGYQVAQNDTAPVTRAPPAGSVQSSALAPLPAADQGAATSAPSSSSPPTSSLTPGAAEHPALGGERAGVLEHPAAPEHMAAPAATAPAPPPVPATQPAAAPARAYTPPPQTVAARPERRAPEAPKYAVNGKVVASSGVFMEYEVSKGDHVDALAREFSTTRKAIVEANRLRPPYAVKPGQIIKIPVSKAYVVEAGDTLNLIAKRFEVEVAELTELNHVSRRSLEPGQKIALPATAHDRGPIRVAGPSEYAEAPPPRRQTYTPPPQAYTPPSQNPYGGHTYTPGGETNLPASGGQVATNLPPRAMPPGRPQIPDTSPTLSDAEISKAARGRFIWPVRGDLLGRFGPTGVGRRNDGLDIKAAQGTVVRAAADGDVVYAGDQVPGFGNLVLVKHADGWVTAYAHLDRLSVQMRQTVTQGQEIGQVGISGGVTEPQLHFEVRYAPNPADKAKPVDPTLVLPR